MALESFYGGKPGYSPTIKGTFKYISTNDSRYQNLSTQDQNAAIANNQVMDECFKNPAYTDVWYGELCIISSDSLYDPNNGKIFRRTLKKQSSEDELYDTLYAEYLGQIVGIPGGLPKVVFNTIDNIKYKATLAQSEIWYPTGIENESGFVQTNNQSLVGTNPENSPLKIFTSSGSSIELVPGKQEINGTTVFNDNFEYTWLQTLETPQVNNNNNEHDGTAATLDIGLKIPYLVIEPTAKSVPYTQRIDVKETNESANHPFYKQYEFSIPDGVRGLGIKNLRIETKQSLNLNNIEVLDPNKNIFAYDSQNRIVTVTLNENTKKDFKSYANNSPFWVYDLVIPNRTDLTLNDARICTCFAGDCVQISNLILSPEGILTLEKTYGESISVNEETPIKWITSTNINTDLTDDNNYGNFTINYNTNKSHSENDSEENDSQEKDSQTFKLPLVKNIIISKNIVASSNETNGEVASSNETNGEKIQISLADANNGLRELTLKKSVVENDEQILSDYILKYPTKVWVERPTVTINSEEQLSDFYYLYVTYNDTTSKELGAVGLANVENAGYSIAIGEENLTDPEKPSINYHFPLNDTFLKEDAPLLLTEEITFDDILTFFPPFWD